MANLHSMKIVQPIRKRHPMYEKSYDRQPFDTSHWNMKECSYQNSPSFETVKSSLSLCSSDNEDHSAELKIHALSTISPRCLNRLPVRPWATPFLVAPWVPDPNKLGLLIIHCHLTQVIVRSNRLRCQT